MEREDRAKRPRGAMRCSHKRIFRIIGRVREARARRAEKNDLHRGDFVLRPRFSRRRVKKIRSRRVVRGVRSAALRSLPPRATSDRPSTVERTPSRAFEPPFLARERVSGSRRGARGCSSALSTPAPSSSCRSPPGPPPRSPRAGSSAPVAAPESVRATPFPRTTAPSRARAASRILRDARVTSPSLGALSFSSLPRPSSR